MRINSIPPKDLLNRYRNVQNKTVVAKPAPSVDKTELTSEAKTFSTAFKAAKAAIETRSPEELKRIEKVKQQIVDGTYYVSGEDVAKKILGE